MQYRNNPASYPWTIAIAPVNITSANRWLIEGCTISFIFGIFLQSMIGCWGDGQHIAMQIESSMSSNIPKEYVANLLVQHPMKLGCIASSAKPECSLAKSFAVSLGCIKQSHDHFKGFKAAKEIRFGNPSISTGYTVIHNRKQISHLVHVHSMTNLFMLMS